VSALLPSQLACERLRVFVRDEPQEGLAKALVTEQIPFVDVAFNFTPLGIERHLAEEVVDTSLSATDRAQSLLQLASLDMAHRRHALAAERFHLLIPYFERTGNYASSALSHLCLLEIAIAAERTDLARLHGLHALRDALKGNAIPALLNAAAALARLEEREQRWLEAAAMYQSAATLASSYLHMQAAGEHHYDAGRCFWQGQSFAAGYDAWNRALRIAQQGQDWVRVIRVLEELERALAPTNLEAHKAQIAEALSHARTAQCGSGCIHAH
jgi:tetratricopeptide (TPR) repeat protein